MFTRKVKSRLYIFIALLALVLLLIYFVFKSLEKNVVYFFSPTEIFNNKDISVNKTIRIGGLVKKGSIIEKDDNINFIITDLKNEIFVSYKGITPNLFLEEKGVVAEGKLQDKKYFIADKILAKHDENYMPPEVKDSLNNSSN
tara:strand:- start:100 stop:528 length:429 start_codon:yes stop_codon:yes gene_type:complete